MIELRRQLNTLLSNERAVMRAEIAETLPPVPSLVAILNREDEFAAALEAKLRETMDSLAPPWQDIGFQVRMRG